MRKMLFGVLLSAAMFCFGSFGVGIFSVVLVLAFLVLRMPMIVRLLLSK